MKKLNEDTEGICSIENIEGMGDVKTPQNNIGSGDNFNLLIPYKTWVKRKNKRKYVKKRK